MKRLLSSIAFVVFLLSLGLFPVQEVRASRDASFVAPRTASSSVGGGDQAVTIEPQADVNAGDTPLNVGRRATFFFVNQTAADVEIEGVSVNGDSNVKAVVVSDDCSKEGRIKGSSRCSVTIETTPTGSGSWTAELLMTHKSLGRIARARVTGKTSGGGGDKKETGLSISSKNVNPVDFGEVAVGTGKAVRTALMVNDSSELISLLSIEVIAPENGLERLEQGCAIDMDLKPGESCPVTLLWSPEHAGNVSTDLIIRHSGQLGFAVIPVRGMASEFVSDGAGGTSSSAPKRTASSGSSSSSPRGSSGSKGIPMSPTTEELQSMIDRGAIPSVSGRDLQPAPSDVLSPDNSMLTRKASASSGTGGISDYHLIGTVGNRAILYQPDGTTATVSIGDEIRVDEENAFSITNIEPKSIEILFQGKKKKLPLESVASLTARAQSAAQNNMQQTKGTKGFKKGSSDDASSSSVNVMDSSGSSSVPLPAGKK